MEDRDLFGSKGWEGIQADHEIGETFVEGALKKLRWRVVIMDWLEVVFSGFGTIVGGLMRAESFIVEDKSGGENNQEKPDA